MSRELRRQLFGKRHERHSRSRSPYRHRSYEERPHRSRSSKYDDRDRDRDYHHDSDSRRRRTSSPGRRRGRSPSRSRSPVGRRNCSPVRDGSEERRARIEQWNREREEKEPASKVNTEETGNGHNGRSQNASAYHENQQQRESPREGY